MSPKDSKEIRPTGILNETDVETIDGALLKPEGQIAKKRSYTLVWRNIFLMTVIHIFALYGGWLLITNQPKWQTIVFGE